MTDNGSVGQQDLGVPSSRPLPEGLERWYLLESDGELDIRRLLGDQPLVAKVLRDAVAQIHQSFGCDARPMIAAMWSLKEPIEESLHVVVYSPLSRERLLAAQESFEREWWLQIKEGLRSPLTIESEHYDPSVT